MYKKINLDDEELLFTQQHQSLFQKPNAVLLDTDTKARQYIANTFNHTQKPSVHGIMLTTTQHLIETKTLLAEPFSLKAITPRLILNHVIQANATRLILVVCHPASEFTARDQQSVKVSHLRQALFDYSLWLDDVFVITQGKEGERERTITSLTGLGFV
ncbi:JAB domain-containing protein [Reinekea sp. G2M2-21]|uniref:JAB domain-containing protein n=1 Tax=Reinekea sp. G2M2-21 TaxID=2788942 RepID=UPI0018A9DA0F|nr:JAB domain-containing protein [Reinekea sp. G2M2-21]